MTAELPGSLVGVTVSILNVICVIVMGCVAVTVTVSFSPVLFDIDFEVVPGLPGADLDDVGRLLGVDFVDTSGLPDVDSDIVRGVPEVVFGIEPGAPESVVVGLNTPVVAVKDVFVPFVPLVPLLLGG